jgi:beta-galactosidase/beta-glucuronidase
VIDAHGYPRPQLVRPHWASLNGAWDFAIDADARWAVPPEIVWDRTIVVPYAPETDSSGIADPGFYQVCWYRRRFERPNLAPGERLLLHFGAVDHSATVWVNGAIAARHDGGYTPFSVDITRFLVGAPEQLIVVRAYDDPADLAKPRGKQDWQLEPHSIWYPRTTGIWQTVWLEKVPAWRIASLRWSANLEQWDIGMQALVLGEGPQADLRLRVRLHVRGQTLSDDTYAVIGGEVRRRVSFSDPGIDDYRNELLWSPTQPTLLLSQLQLTSAEGRVIDEVESYTALRSVAIQGERFLLNGRVQDLRMILDQGYWPGTGLTSPDDASIRRDIQLTKAMGFNGARKHQKIEDPRYLYWADVLGLLVWEEMPSAYRFTRESIERLTREWIDVIERDSSHPCIVAWVPFNESWGVPDLPAIAAQRHYVQALYHLTKTLDPSRPVVGNDGWESVATDIIGIHDYDADPQRLARRYAHVETVPQLFKHGRPGGRLLTVEGHPFAGQPVMLTEFGGIKLAHQRDAWGYSQAEDAAELASQFTELLSAVKNSELLAGFCYTQFADTYQESNGLLYPDRTPKFPIEDIARAVRGRALKTTTSPLQAALAGETAFSQQTPEPTPQP